MIMMNPMDCGKAVLLPKIHYWDLVLTATAITMHMPMYAAEASSSSSSAVVCTLPNDARPLTNSRGREKRMVGYT